MATVPPVVLPPWVVERDRYNIKLPHIDTLLAIADKGRTPPRRIRFSIGPVPSGLYKTARDTITCDVPSLRCPPRMIVTRCLSCLLLSVRTCVV
jgi:hypothetical protein